MFDFEDWGLIDYSEADARQSEYVREIQQGTRRSTLVFCEHPTVITMGRATEDGHIVTGMERLQQLGIDVIHNNRGGDVTLHNPGQLVGYPLFHLSHFKEDLHWFLREIEECIMQTLLEFGIMSHRLDGMTGVWIDNSRKVCAIGVHCSRWVMSHGFALNVNNAIDDFAHIIPCGISEKSVTSMQMELGHDLEIQEVVSACLHSFRDRFSLSKKNL